MFTPAILVRLPQSELLHRTHFACFRRRSWCGDREREDFDAWIGDIFFHWESSTFHIDRHWVFGIGTYSSDVVLSKAWMDS